MDPHPLRAPSGSGEGQPSRGLFIIKSGDLSTKPSIGFMILEAVLLKLFIIFFFLIIYYENVFTIE